MCISSADMKEYHTGHLLEWSNETYKSTDNIVSPKISVACVFILDLTQQMDAHWMDILECMSHKWLKKSKINEDMCFWKYSEDTVGTEMCSTVLLYSFCNIHIQCINEISASISFMCVCVFLSFLLFIIINTTSLSSVCVSRSAQIVNYCASCSVLHSNHKLIRIHLCIVVFSYALSTYSYIAEYGPVCSDCSSAQQKWSRIHSEKIVLFMET